MSSFDATRPGRIWLIEHELGHSLAGSDRAALTEVNVVLYRRAVAPVLASVLPLGAYAEATGEAALSPRAIAFAGEGWSVAQLVEACDDSEARLRCLFEALNALGRIADLPVQIVVKPAVGRQRELDMSVRTAAASLRNVAGEGLLTLAFGPVPMRFASPQPGHVFTANGLAG